MFRLVALCSFLSVAASPALAGDVVAGAELFSNCRACHRLQDGAAQVVSGGTIAPNLFGVIGRKVGSYPGYEYSSALKEMGENGMVWTEEDLARFVANPNVFVSSSLGKDGAVTKMPYDLPEGGEDVAAYLASIVKK